MRSMIVQTFSMLNLRLSRNFFIIDWFAKQKKKKEIYGKISTIGYIRRILFKSFIVFMIHVEILSPAFTYKFFVIFTIQTYCGVKKLGFPEIFKFSFDLFKKKKKKFRPSRLPLEPRRKSSPFSWCTSR